MSVEPWGVVIKCPLKDPGKIRVGSRLGARLPTVIEDNYGFWRSGRGLKAGEGLPIWWDNRLVPEGYDRLRRALADTEEDGAYFSRPNPSIEYLLSVADYVVVRDLGRVLLLGADRRVVGER